MVSVGFVVKIFMKMVNRAREMSVYIDGKHLGSLLV